jgi:hypothetical protein
MALWCFITPALCYFKLLRFLQPHTLILSNVELVNSWRGFPEHHFFSALEVWTSGVLATTYSNFPTEFLNFWSLLRNFAPGVLHVKNMEMKRGPIDG